MFRATRTWPLAILLAAATGVPAAAAWQATPEAGGIAPRPEECTVAPRTLPLEIALATPVPASPGPVLPSHRDLPPGSPAEAAAVEAVTATVAEALACRNAGDLLAAYALMTDDLVLKVIGPPGGVPPELVALLSEKPDKVRRAERLELAEVGEARTLPDGRVAATVVTRNAGTEFTDVLVFVERDGGWLIDEAYAVSRAPRD